jgi:hypothetical protein
LRSQWARDRILALKLSDALVEVGFTRAQAAQFVRDHHEEWLQGISRLEWPEYYPPPEPIPWAPTNLAIDEGEALVRGVQGGIYSPNEARNLEGLNSVGYGDEPRVQQQVVPLSAAATIPIPPAPSPPAPASAAAAEATKDYQAAVRREIDAIDALVARAKHPPLNGPTIRKTKVDA